MFKQKNETNKIPRKIAGMKNKLEKPSKKAISISNSRNLRGTITGNSEINLESKQDSSSSALLETSKVSDKQERSKSTNKISEKELRRKFGAVGNTKEQHKQNATIKSESRLKYLDEQRREIVKESDEMKQGSSNEGAVNSNNIFRGTMAEVEDESKVTLQFHLGNSSIEFSEKSVRSKQRSSSSKYLRSKTDFRESLARVEEKLKHKDAYNYPSHSGDLKRNPTTGSIESKQRSLSTVSLHSETESRVEPTQKDQKLVEHTCKTVYQPETCDLNSETSNEIDKNRRISSSEKEDVFKVRTAKVMGKCGSPIKKDSLSFYSPKSSELINMEFDTTLNFETISNAFHKSHKWNEVQEGIEGGELSMSKSSGFNRPSKSFYIKTESENNIVIESDLNLDIQKIRGVLTEKIIATGLSDLRQSPDASRYIYTTLELIDKNIHDISVLRFHCFLQSINLSWNHLTDVSALGNIAHLQYLNLSHNYLSKLLDFSPPRILIDVDYSFNRIKQLGDLSNFWSLRRLNVSHNIIQEIGILALNYLQDLNLSYNKIMTVGQLDLPNLVVLNLEANEIQEFKKGLVFMDKLIYLHLKSNKLTSLMFLNNISNLHYLNLENNEITVLYEIHNLTRMRMLKELHLANNVISTRPKYREYVIYKIPSLTILDALPTSAEEKVSANNTIGLNMFLNAAKQHSYLLFHEQLKTPVIDLDVIPVDQPSYPFVILVGPPSSGKAYLLKKMAEEFGSKVYIGLHHTTYEQTVLKNPSREKYFVTENCFMEMIKNGEFLTVTRNWGKSFGFSRNELSNAIRTGSVCLTNMWLSEVFMLHPCGIIPQLVLVIPENVEVHHKRFMDDFDVHKLICSREGAYAVEHVFDHAHIATNISQVIAQTMIENVFQRATKETHLSQVSLVPSKINRSTSSSTNVSRNILERFAMLGFSSETSMSGMMLGSLTDGSKLKLSVDSSIDIDKFKKILETYTVASSKDQDSSVDMVDLSTEDVSREVDIEPYGSLSNYLFQHRQLDTISEESSEKSQTLYSSYISTLKTEEEDQESSKGIIADTCFHNLFQIGLQQREGYLKLCKESPSFFDTVIFSDDLEEACCKLKKFLKKRVFNLKKYPINSMEKDPLFNKVSSEKVRKFISDYKPIKNTNNTCTCSKLK